ncbi:hypothetical protein ACFXPE_10750, partial [Streptomyces scopuliridis]|uniref:hypothetical protein n=1 Tax=Streptomyces scopuliridis TaxID=452529 RepID=UPI00369A6401
MSDLPPRRGWTVFTEEIPAEVMLDMPPDLAKRTVNFLVSLALEVGGAPRAAQDPPPPPRDYPAGRYSLHIE